MGDSVVLPIEKNYLRVMAQNASSSLLGLRYISPELISLIEDNNFYYYDKEKSDIFILGMLILELSLLSPIEFYDKNHKKLDLYVLAKNLKAFKEKYASSTVFVAIVEQMLNLEPKGRPAF